MQDFNFKWASVSDNDERQQFDNVLLLVGKIGHSVKSLVLQTQRISMAKFEDNVSPYRSGNVNEEERCRELCQEQPRYYLLFNQIIKAKRTLPAVLHTSGLLKKPRKTIARYTV